MTMHPVFSWDQIILNGEKKGKTTDFLNEKKEFPGLPVNANHSST